jgi:hypothetical protein
MRGLHGHRAGSNLRRSEMYKPEVLVEITVAAL